MKRSDMINHGATKLQQLMGWLLTPEQARDIVKDLLEHFEKYGMLPPPYHINIYDNQPISRGGISVNEWEPEDE